MSKIFISILTIIIIICVALAILLYVSLFPHRDLIGWIALVLLIIIAICAAVFVIVFTYTKTGTMFYDFKRARLHSNLIVYGNYAVLMNEDKTYSHISAEHMAACAPLALPTGEAPIEPLPYYAKDVQEMAARGISDHTIAKSFQITENEVRKVLNS